MPSGQRSTVPNQRNPIAGTFFNLTGKSQYDVSKFYTASTDSKGHYETTRLKMTPNIQAIAESIVASSPDYSSVADFIRDAMIHRAMHFHTHGIPVDEGRLKIELHTAEMASLRLKIESQRQYIEDCAATLDVAIEAGDWTTMADIISEMQDVYEQAQFPQTTQEALGRAIEDAWERMGRGRSVRQERRAVTGQ